MYICSGMSLTILAASHVPATVFRNRKNGINGIWKIETDNGTDISVQEETPSIDWQCSCTLDHCIRAVTEI